MMSPRSRRNLLAAAARIKDVVDEGVLRAKRATGVLRPLRARPYQGHGTASLVHVKGRVREQTGVASPLPSHRPVQNLVAMVRRFTATPVPGARVLVEVGGTQVQVSSDADGYFRAAVQPELTLEPGWHDLSATLLADATSGRPEGETLSSQVLVPAPDASFGIISDLDDTVIRSEITSPARALATMLFHNASTRAPFQGVATFYKALQAGPSGEQSNPLFYVSSSPWNLYDLITAFLEVQGIPVGPLFLRAWGLDADALPGGGHSGHKSGLILGLLDTYPTLPFVLIGDSGQQDPEIYRDVVIARPGRILSVYIRDVTTPERDAVVGAVAQQVRDLGVEFVLVPDTDAAARHATDLGLVAVDALPDVVEAVEEAELTEEIVGS
ncbi:MAG: DUF2183 domain-containing protein [Actinomycetota bacterium]|nr:DUF2183 domain-containing protein [Actinomycetota bacterium]